MRRKIVTEAKAAPRADCQAWRLRDWCQQVSISPCTAYRLIKRGEGPATFRVGAVQYVSRRASADWIAAREAASAPEGTVSA
jgi:predicted DNA-binding transcriptional regulator AlpA